MIKQLIIFTGLICNCAIKNEFWGWNKGNYDVAIIAIKYK